MLPHRGHNLIFSKGGNDTITTGDGRDRIFAGSGHDIIHAGDGANLVLAGNGNDIVVTGQDRDLVYGGNGDDVIITGRGRDTVFAGAGHDIVSGGGGNDTLFGGPGRNILIGGRGRDVLFGLGSEDILIGGFTTHDENPAALSSILTEWSTEADYDSRVAVLREGTGAHASGLKLIPDDTVFDDEARDMLFGFGLRDWFFADLDNLERDDDFVIGKLPEELLDSL